MVLELISGTDNDDRNPSYRNLIGFFDFHGTQHTPLSKISSDNGDTFLNIPLLHYDLIGNSNIIFCLHVQLIESRRI